MLTVTSLCRPRGAALHSYDSCACVRVFAGLDPAIVSNVLGAYDKWKGLHVILAGSPSHYAIAATIATDKADNLDSTLPQWENELARSLSLMQRLR